MVLTLLVDMLEEEIKAVDKDRVKCVDRSCPRYGQKMRCYLFGTYDWCDLYMQAYKHRRPYEKEKKDS